LTNWLISWATTVHDYDLSWVEELCWLVVGRVGWTPETVHKYGAYKVVCISIPYNRPTAYGR
jgi:hypothetical protein